MYLPLGQFVNKFTNQTPIAPRSYTCAIIVPTLLATCSYCHTSYRTVQHKVNSKKKTIEMQKV
jgi:hypothetical protein